MERSFDLIARTVAEWARQPDLEETHRNAAQTLRQMASQMSNSESPDLVADKSLKVMACHVCRTTGNVGCNSQTPECPLGFLETSKPSLIGA
ncbi:MAG: hypothetical protein K9J74_11415 [Sulfuritalea sp.]|nr:hypothetical protein [Sulfuritalea sp.]